MFPYIPLSCFAGLQQVTSLHLDEWHSLGQPFVPETIFSRFPRLRADVYDPRPVSIPFGSDVLLQISDIFPSVRRLFLQNVSRAYSTRWHALAPLRDLRCLFREFQRPLPAGRASPEIEPALVSPIASVRHVHLSSDAPDDFPLADLCPGASDFSVGWMGGYGAPKCVPARRRGLFAAAVSFLPAAAADITCNEMGGSFAS